jgi:DNA-binding NarL/FixJ family response regulator
MSAKTSLRTVSHVLPYDSSSPGLAPGRGHAPRVRVLIAEVEAERRAELGRLVTNCPDLELVGLAMDADDAVELLGTHRPDVALLDARMPRGGAPRAIRAIRSQRPETGVVLHCACPDGGQENLLIRSLKIEMLVKGIASPDQILAAIRRVATSADSAAAGGDLADAV